MTTNRDEVLHSRLKPVGEPQPPRQPARFSIEDVVILLEGLQAYGGRVRWGGEATTHQGSLREGLAEAEHAGSLWRPALAWYEATHQVWVWARRRRGVTPDTTEIAAAHGRLKALEAELDLDQRLALERWLDRSWTSPRACLLCGGRDGAHATRGRALP